MDEPKHALRRPGADLACALIAQAANVLLAAVLAAHLGGAYQQRAWAFLAGTLWTVAGTAVLFARTAGAARAGAAPLTAGRVGLWIVSAWLWPVLLLRRGATAREPAEPNG